MNMERPDWLKKAGVPPLKEIEEACKKQSLKQKNVNKKFIDKSKVKTKTEHANNINDIEQKYRQRRHNQIKEEQRIDEIKDTIANSDDIPINNYHEKVIKNSEHNIQSYEKQKEDLYEKAKTKYRRKEQTDATIENLENNPINLN